MNPNKIHKNKRRCNRNWPPVRGENKGWLAMWSSFWVEIVQLNLLFFFGEPHKAIKFDNVRGGQWGCLERFLGNEFW